MKKRSNSSEVLATTEAPQNAPEKDTPDVWWGGLLHRRFQFLLDLAVLVAALWISYLIRFDFSIPKPYVEAALVQTPLVVLIQFGCLVGFGAYSFLWKYVGLRELRSFANAALWSFLPVLILRLGLPEQFRNWSVPLSVIVLDTLLAFGLVTGLRVIRRIVYERYERKTTSAAKDSTPVILIGAGRAGVIIAKEIQSRPDLAFDVKGFVDDDASKHGLHVEGVKVLGNVSEIATFAEQVGAKQAIVTIAKASRSEFRRFIDICEKANLRARTVPGLGELIEGGVEFSRIRDVEIEDLLGRAPVELEVDSIEAMIRGKTVLVTGAGGSIGSELARQALRFGPTKLLLAERSEGALFNIDREVGPPADEECVVPLIADVTDEGRVREIFAQYQPDVVLHAAAHKHVPMMERNPLEAIKNNILGTRCVARVAGEFGADAFVLISTDKAVRPTSIMGASKRAAELVLQNVEREFSKTRYVAVRFGNVLGSAGSVIPIFREQIRKGGPVTVTHRDMVRYFMTIPEASQLVLQAAAMGEGGEIFVLDMGEPVRIVDLATDMISLSGLKPYEDIDIHFSGMRPGEKLFEELATDGEEITKTRHPKIFIGKIERTDASIVDEAVNTAQRMISEADAYSVAPYLASLIPEATLGAMKDRVQANEDDAKPAHAGTGKVIPHPALAQRR